jgi:Fe-S cluster assembly iron-binding protein IscA
MTKKNTFLQFDGTEVVAEIIGKMPEAIEILQAHGLSCASCHMNVSEPLAEGIRGHGMSDKDVQIILKDLNEAAEELKIPLKGRIVKDPELTEAAAEKVIEFQTEADQIGYGFKIEVLPDTVGSAQYYLDFLPKPDKGDRIIESRGIKLFLDRESLIFLRNSMVDYVVDPEKGEGFKIERM